MNSSKCRTLEEQCKILRREGKILERLDWEKDDGFHTELWILHNGSEFMVKMVNGTISWIREFK